MKIGEKRKPGSPDGNIFLSKILGKNEFVIRFQILEKQKSHCKKHKTKKSK